MRFLPEETRQSLSSIEHYPHRRNDFHLTSERLVGILGKKNDEIIGEERLKEIGANNSVIRVGK